MLFCDFDSIQQNFGMVKREQNTIIDKWPLRFTKRASDEGAKEEFERYFASLHMGVERYVEWRRAS